MMEKCGKWHTKIARNAVLFWSWYLHLIYALKFCHFASFVSTLRRNSIISISASNYFNLSKYNVYYKNNAALSISQHQMRNSASWLLQWRILYSVAFFRIISFLCKSLCSPSYFVLICTNLCTSSFSFSLQKRVMQKFSHKELA